MGEMSEKCKFILQSERKISPEKEKVLYIKYAILLDFCISLKRFKSH
jgi:hypothetical protein